MSNILNLSLPALEFRASPRKELQQSGKLLGSNAVPAEIKILDISRGGLGMIVTEPKQHGDPCAVAFSVSINDSPKRINAWAKVTYCRKHDTSTYKVGIRFWDYDLSSKAYIEQLCEAGEIMVGY